MWQDLCSHSFVKPGNIFLEKFDKWCLKGGGLHQFDRQHFISFGELRWSMHIWVICPWNKFGKKAQCVNVCYLNIERLCGWNTILLISTTYTLHYILSSLVVKYNLYPTKTTCKVHTKILTIYALIRRLIKWIFQDFALRFCLYSYCEVSGRFLIQILAAIFSPTSVSQDRESRQVFDKTSRDQDITSKWHY